MAPITINREIGVIEPDEDQDGSEEDDTDDQISLVIARLVFLKKLTMMCILKLNQWKSVTKRQYHLYTFLHHQPRILSSQFKAYLGRSHCHLEDGAMVDQAEHLNTVRGTTSTKGVWRIKLVWYFSMSSVQTN